MDTAMCFLCSDIVANVTPVSEQFACQFASDFPPKMAPNLRALRGRVQAAFDALPRPAIAPLSFELEDAKTSRWTEPCLALACNNMSALYDEAGWGWSDDKKRAELAEPGMRLLVIRDGDTLAAFSSFLVDTEETAADDDSLCTVVYWCARHPFLAT